MVTDKAVKITSISNTLQFFDLLTLNRSLRVDNTRFHDTIGIELGMVRLLSSVSDRKSKVILKLN
jgi:hypothetical protein